MNVQDLFLQALDIDCPDQRAQFLLQACGDDEHLRQEVEGLLQAHHDAGTFLEKPYLERLHQSGPGHVEADKEASPVAVDNNHSNLWNVCATICLHRNQSSSERTPTHSPRPASFPPYIPGYEIVQLLGRGGMGVVYLARQRQANRLVALKVILPERHANPEERQRFRREVEAIARLQHPGIVQIFEVGEYEGCPFFSLEYCPGGSLDHYLSGVPLPPGEAAELTLSLTSSVQVAHNARILHRDLKPANVLLTSSSTSFMTNPETLEGEATRPPLQATQVKLTDFGLAKKLDETTQTKTGMILGTPSYMSPEQAQANKPVGVEADVYALGAILYECLTGRPPFRAATVLETMMQVTKQEPVAPRQLQPNLPRDLETICLKCLQKEPHRRYGSAQELAEDLQRFLENRPIQARPVGPVERGWRWVRRNPLVASLLATIFLVLSAGIFATTLKWIQADNHLRDAQRQERLAEDNLKKVEKQKREADHQRHLAFRNAEKANRKAIEASRNSYYLLVKGALDAWYDNRIRGARLNLEKCDQCDPDIKGWEPDIKGWEYAYLRHLLYSQGRINFNGHTQSVRQVHFSPDGRFLVSIAPREILVWNLQKQRLAHTWKVGFALNPIHCFSADGTRFARISRERIVGVWNLQTGAEMAMQPGEALAIPMLGYDRNRQAIVRKTLGKPGPDAPTDPFVKQPVVPREMALSPDGKLILTVYDAGVGRSIRPADGQIQLWDAKTLQLRRTLRKKIFTPRSPAFCGSKPKVAWLEPKAGLIRIYSLTNHRQVGTISDTEGLLEHFVVSPDGKQIATITNRGRVASSIEETHDKYITGMLKLWDVESRKLLARFRGVPEQITCLGFSPDGRHLATGTPKGDVTVWDTHQGDGALLIRRRRVEDMCFTPDSQRLLTVTSGTPEVHFFDLTNGKLVRTVPGKRNAGDAAFSADGKRLLTGDKQTPPRRRKERKTSRIRVLDLKTGREEYRLEMTHGHVYNLEISPSGQYVAATTFHIPRLKVWDVHNHNEVVLDRRMKNKPGELAFNPTANELAFVDQGGDLFVWKLPARTEAIHHKQKSPILAVCYSPDGSLLATGDVERTVKLWNSKTGKLLHVFQGHSSIVTGVSFSPDGKRLASCGRDGNVKFWDPVNLHEVITLGVTIAGRRPALTHIAFSPDGRRLAALATKIGVVVWDAGKDWKASRK